MAKQRSMTIKASIWWDESDSCIRIQLIDTDRITTVSRDPTSKRCHEHLFDLLAEHLRANDRPAP